MTLTRATLTLLLALAAAGCVPEKKKAPDGDGAVVRESGDVRYYNGDGDYAGAGFDTASRVTSVAFVFWVHDLKECRVQVVISGRHRLLVGKVDPAVCGREAEAAKRP